MNSPSQTASARTHVRPLTLRARDVADLTITSGYPSISVLLPTQPAPRMTPADRGRLRRLITEVDHALRERGVTTRGRLVEKLGQEARHVAGQPTSRGVAIYVSLAISRSFRLPQPVEARAVVERTFATRPLVSALHRMPPHVVLVLHATCAHLYAAADGCLQPAEQLDPLRIRLPGPGDAAVDEARSDLGEGYLRAVDRMLGDYRTKHPSPLVLAGSPAVLDRFCVISRNLERLAGRVHPGEDDNALDLALACFERIEEYLRNRREDALGQLRRASGVRPADVLAGIEDCWAALRSRAPEMLLVEEGYVSPGDPAGSSSQGVIAGTTGEVHDLVDDLIEQVILRGGQIALVRDGDLDSFARVALISRGRRP